MHPCDGSGLKASERTRALAVLCASPYAGDVLETYVCAPASRTAVNGSFAPFRPARGRACAFSSRRGGPGDRGFSGDASALMTPPGWIRADRAGSHRVAWCCRHDSLRHPDRRRPTMGVQSFPLLPPLPEGRRPSAAPLLSPLLPLAMGLTLTLLIPPPLLLRGMRLLKWRRRRRRLAATYPDAAVFGTESCRRAGPAPGSSGCTSKKAMGSHRPSDCVFGSFGLCWVGSGWFRTSMEGTLVDEQKKGRVYAKAPTDIVYYLAV